MANPFPDKIWNYKNFNMVTELDISGEFIYDGIQTLNQLTNVDEVAMLFSFLYHISVGIERLQKIVIVLFENVTLENHEEFEKRLITHNHSELNARISRSTNTTLNARENELLALLASFYKTARYQRFSAKPNYYQERVLIAAFVEKYLSPEKIQKNPFNNALLITDDIKELFGRVIGSISQKYYSMIRKGCTQNSTYTYELRPASKAEKIFLLSYKNNSLQEQKINEMIVLKELFVYLRNTKQSNSFMRFLEDIPPLELDIALLNEYFSDICNGIVPQSLMDEVDSLYEENSYSIERKNLVSLVGDTNVLFDFMDIDECIKMLTSLADNDCDYEHFATEFPKQLELVEDDCTHEILDDVVDFCSQYLAKKINPQELVQHVIPYCARIKTFYNRQ